MFCAELASYNVHIENIIDKIYHIHNLCISILFLTNLCAETIPKTIKKNAGNSMKLLFSIHPSYVFVRN